MYSYMSPKIAIRVSQVSGRGLYAVQPIEAGELLVDYTDGPGCYISLEEANAYYDERFDYMLQVDEDSFFVARAAQVEDADFINHSCDPNCGIVGSLQIVARRHIEVGEEICFDYAMSETSNWNMYCNCGSPLCRQRISGEDWQLAQLQERYRGFFSNYIQLRIDNT